MRRRLRIHISPAIVISMLALFVTLAGTGVASNIVPLARKALTANKAKVADVAKNAQKLDGQTAGQVAAIPGPATDAATLNGQTAAQIAGTPGPVSSLPASLFTVRQDSFELSQEGKDARSDAHCAAGEKAIAGGWAITEGLASVTRDSPLPDGSGWQFRIFADSGNNLPAIGLVYAICVKVS